MATTTTVSGVRELTVRAIVVGGLITLIFIAANVYLGLKVGLTFATSIPAAVISVGAALLRRPHDRREQHRPDDRIGGRDAVGDQLRAAGSHHDRLVERAPLLDHGRRLRSRRHPRRDVLDPVARPLVTGSDLPYPEEVAGAEVLKVGERTDGADDSRVGVEEVHSH
jgi:hypothetical protein